jgi:hypothetical protein
VNTAGPGATAWTSSELATIERASEIEVATRRADGSPRTARIVWVVRHGDSLYVRSVNGVDAAWYRGVQSRHEGVVTVGRVGHEVAFVEVGDHAGDETGLDDALDAAYRTKYGRSSGAVERITAQPARETTLRLDRA